MLSVTGTNFRISAPEVYGEPPDESISHAAKIYGLSAILAAIALTQWLIIGSTELLTHNRSEERYGWWLLCTFFAVATLSWTKFGRKVPFNYIIIGAIVESSTIYIAMEQRHNENRLVNFYAGIVVVALMLVSIFWGAYFPMFVVPGDLLLSCLVVIANIMMIIFFINVLFINYQGIYYAVRNTFALVAICMVMYTATIIHDRQFDVPKNEYLFLSVLQFFSYMILHERILAISFTSTKKTGC
ncbi:uncharacterized protein LOC6527793 [Drosophila yakuba]|uniref:Uncharacterized protein n=1 Tax=Drosophila yakuba TaxID=7245 RepID=B4NXI7_DROYA|nr:uncharacterized protein LOC6527793 [Drosophila yakuba]EDW88578.1 uncharacterized protein Dyak_GE18800 [Drosophila yakuba]